MTPAALSLLVLAENSSTSRATPEIFISVQLTIITFFPYNSYVCFLPGTLDIQLLQFSSFGELLWKRGTGTSLNDEGYGVSVSADGLYVYVTGYTEDSLNGQTFAGECNTQI